MEFMGGDAPASLAYKDIKEVAGDRCAVKITGLSLPPAKAEEHELDIKCCIEVQNAANLKITICSKEADC